jgi:UDP-GlcNAc:undecaprenyl-phosphate/decaprenyl-phosphate GlcNAc-1-phosphate transferase
MLFSIAVTLLFLSFFASVVLTGFLRNLAKQNNLLIDIPNKSRKFHFRPTPLIGGVSIHLAMLLSSLFMFFLIDYKYDIQLSKFTGTGFKQQSKVASPIYTQKLKIINEEGESIESIRVHVAPQKSSGLKTPLYNVQIGALESNSLRILKLDDDKFMVFHPNGQSSTFQASPSGIVELNSLGEALSKPINIKTGSKNFFSFSSFTLAFIVIALALQIFTLIDDAYGVRPWKRMLAQSAATLILIVAGDVWIASLNLSIFSSNLGLGYLAIPFTVVAVTGVVNAFNMIDGINGLCAGLALIALGALQISSGFAVANYTLMIAMGSIIGFLFYNLGFLGNRRRVFLGDNGSTFLGFLVAWTCINYSQSEIQLIDPVTCLWIIAVPLWDCLGVMIGRSINGVFPFSPGRDHIHHKLQEYTKSSHKTLAILLSSGILFATIGVFIEQSSITSELSLLIFFGASIAYYLFSFQLSKINHKANQNV